MKKQIVKSGEGTIEKRLFYAKAVYGEEEKRAVLKSLDNPWLASGPLVKEFEGKVAKLFGKKYGIAVNSGSSANLLALASLNLPEGSEVITPACTFATTVSVIYQNNLTPVFLDTVIGRYTMNTQKPLLEEAIREKTKAILIPHLVGGVANLRILREIADKYGLYLIDDSCDTIAPQLNGKPIARFSDLATTSFYGSHIITACGFGGMIMTDDEKLREKIIVLRDWGRVGGDKEDFESRFNFEIEGIPYDRKFLYSALGYNLKLNEAGAAFGLEQLKRLPKFLKIRKRNFNALLKYFSQYENFFYLPELIPEAETNWLAFPLTIRTQYGKKQPFKRYDFLKHMEEHGIQTRVLFSGNIVYHPIYRVLPRRIVGGLTHANIIMGNGLLLGCHQGMTLKDVKYLTDTADKFLSKI